VITADARIDNRDVLIRDLQLSPSTGQVIPDSTLILRAYEEWGQDCVDHLLGAFSFAVWDPRRDSLFCAVDHLGVKQLYYTQALPQGFALGSEIKALLLLDEVQCTIDEEELGRNLAWMPRSSDSTLFEEIQSLAPAHALRVTSDGVETWKYWEIEPSDEAQSLSTQECIERFKALFKESVQCRLRSAHPVGAELSGGLDSSFVTCMASDLLSDETPPIKTFSLVYDELPDCDEREYIREVVSEKDIVPYYVKGDEIGPVSTATEVFDTVDDGRLGGGNSFLRWHLYKRAQETDVRVVLTGTDGDSTVSHGTERFAELAADEQWQSFQTLAEQYVKNLDQERAEYAIHGQDDSSPERILEKAGFSYLNHWATTGQWRPFLRSAIRISSLFDVSLLEIGGRFWKRLIAPESLVRARIKSATEASRKEVPPVVDTAFAHSIGLPEKLSSYRRATENLPSVRKNQLKTFRGELIADELQHYNQYASAHSIEARHPFMDIRLIQFCLGMSSEMSFQDGWTRAIMRWSMEEIVPETIQWRTAKTNMAEVFNHGLLEVDGELASSLLSDLGPMAPFVDESYMQDLLSTQEEKNELDFTLLASILGKVVWARKMSERGFCEININKE
jgi:asparagine synthase (glutamine-hydrolysing)